MFIQYLIANDGEGLFGVGTIEEADLTWQPTECFWLVPGTYEDLVGGPQFEWLT